MDTNILSTLQETQNKIMEQINSITLDLNNQIQNTIIGFQEPDDSKTSTVIITYEEYLKDPSCLNKCKLPGLRGIIRHYKSTIQLKIRYPILRNYSASEILHLKTRVKDMYDFALTGTKQKHIERITSFFKQISSAIKIQKLARGRLVRHAHMLRGPARKDRSVCVNESDFYTLEPLADIPFSNFFSFMGEKGFIYGCELTSIVKYIQNKSHRVKNPYTREIIDPIIPTIHCLYRLQKMFFSRQNEGGLVVSIPLPVPIPPARNNIQSYPSRPLNNEYLANNNSNSVVSVPLPVQISNGLPVQPNIENTRNSIILHNGVDNRINEIMSITNGQQMPHTRVASSRLPSVIPNNNYNMDEMIEKIKQIRRQSFQDRSRSLFMEIDHLGHYTQVEWFTQLSLASYIRFFRCLRDYWMYRAQLSLDTKMKICPLWDPFTAILYDQINYTELSIYQIRNLCISVMEDMVFTGIDAEFRTLGSFHVLSALTIVSLPARNSMMWLYEGLAY